MKPDAPPRVPLLRSLRMELVQIALVSGMGAVVIMLLVNLPFRPLVERYLADYKPGMEAMDVQAQRLAEGLEQLSLQANSGEIQRLLAEAGDRNRGRSLAALLIDPSGRVLASTPASAVTAVDLSRAIQTSAEVRAERSRYINGSEYVAIAPAAMLDAEVYVMIRGVPPVLEDREHPLEAVRAIPALAAFALLFFLLTRGKIRYIEELADGLAVISRGNLSHRVRERGRDELGLLARSINRMAAELEQNIEAERRAERTKDELITGVSHDLRTPLTSMKGYLHLLDTGTYDGPEQMAQYVRTAYGKTEQLQEMVESLFEYTKLAGQGAQLNRQDLNLADLLAQMVEEYVPLFESHGLAFVRDLPRQPAHISADPDLLARVFDNLLTNAVKYSEKPGQITVRLEEQQDGLLATVQNRGPAIAREQLERLFAPFVRLDEARSSKVGGSGLGLAIARRIVELHGGRIWAESDGELVRFQVWLPRLAE